MWPKSSPSLYFSSIQPSFIANQEKCVNQIPIKTVRSIRHSYVGIGGSYTGKREKDDSSGTEVETVSTCEDTIEEESALVINYESLSESTSSDI